MAYGAPKCRTKNCCSNNNTSHTNTSNNNNNISSLAATFLYNFYFFGFFFPLATLFGSARPTVPSEKRLMPHSANYE